MLRKYRLRWHLDMGHRGEHHLGDAQGYGTFLVRSLSRSEYQG